MATENDIEISKVTEQQWRDWVEENGKYSDLTELAASYFDEFMITPVRIHEKGVLTSRRTVANSVGQIEQIMEHLKEKVDVVAIHEIYEHDGVIILRVGFLK